MLYRVYTKRSGWDRFYDENTLYIIADSERKAKEIYTKNMKIGRKKIYVQESDKKGIVIFV